MMRREMDHALLAFQRENWEKLTALAERQVALQTEMIALSERFAESMVINKEERREEHKLLHEAAIQLQGHSVRIGSLERMQWMMWGAIGMMAASAIGWVVTFLMIKV